MFITKRASLIGIFLCLLFLGASYAHGAPPEIILEVAQDPSVANPASAINKFYTVALAISGLLAFGALIYGAILYAVSGGNSSLQGEAKDQIKQAFLGILLLAGAYIILYTINPNLVNLSFIAPSSPCSGENGSVLCNIGSGGSGNGEGVPIAPPGQTFEGFEDGEFEGGGEARDF